PVTARRSWRSLQDDLPVFIARRPWRSLHGDLTGHFRVNRAEVGIGARLGESEREFFVGVQHFGLEGFGIIRAHHRVGNVVMVSPGHGAACRNRYHGGSEAEIVDFHFGVLGFLLRGYGGVSRTPYSAPQNNYCDQNCYGHTSPHDLLLW